MVKRLNRAHRLHPHNFLFYDPSRHADNNRVIRDRVQDNRISANFNIIAYPHRSKYLCSCAYYNVITECRVALPFFFSCAAKCHPLVQEAIIPYFRCLSDDDSHPVINKETAPYFCGRMNFDTGDKPGCVGKESREYGYTKIPESMVYAVNENGMKPRIGQQDLNGISRSRITFEDRVIISAYVFPEAHQ